MDLKSIIVGSGLTAISGGFAYGFYTWAQNKPNPDSYIPLEIIMGVIGGAGVLVGGITALRGLYAPKREPTRTINPNRPRNPDREITREYTEEITDAHGNVIRKIRKEYKERRN